MYIAPRERGGVNAHLRVSIFVLRGLRKGLLRWIDAIRPFLSQIAASDSWTLGCLPVTRRLPGASKCGMSKCGMRTILFILVVAAGSAQNPKEATVGAQLAQEVRRRTTAIENPAVQDYIDGIGRKLASQFPAERLYTFSLISDDAGGDTHEPLSLPGGYIFVSADLIRTAAIEAELAGMLAHAMAHVTLPRPQVDGATIPLVFWGGWQGFGPGRDSVIPMSLFKTQRDNETRADLLAVQAVSASGYDPEALTAYIARAQPPPERTAKVFAVLPDRDPRVAALRQAIAELPARAYPSTDPEVFRRMQEQVRNTVRNAVPPVLERPRPTLKRQN
jgi:predicted Zn-dependent protease